MDLKIFIFQVSFNAFVGVPTVAALAESISLKLGHAWLNPHEHNILVGGYKVRTLPVKK